MFNLNFNKIIMQSDRISFSPLKRSNSCIACMTVWISIESKKNIDSTNISLHFYEKAYSDRKINILDVRIFGALYCISTALVSWFAVWPAALTETWDWGRSSQVTNILRYFDICDKQEQ